MGGAETRMISVFLVLYLTTAVASVRGPSAAAPASVVAHDRRGVRGRRTAVQVCKKCRTAVVRL